MIEMATSEDKEVEEKHAATLRKKKQLEDAEKEHERLVKEEEEEEEAEQAKKEEQIRLAEAKRREEQQAKEHEELLKSLAESNATQLRQKLNLDELESITEQQLVDMGKSYDEKQDGGLFSQMETKLQIHENLKKTATALKTIKEEKKNRMPADKTNLLLEEAWRGVPETNSPADVVESAAGQNIPAAPAVYNV